MNTLFALLLAGALHTAAPVESPATKSESTYLVTEQVAVWVSNDQRMHVVLARAQAEAEVQLADEQSVYVRQRIDLSEKAVSQKYDLSGLPMGNYQLTIKTGGQVIRKTIVVAAPAVQRVVTLG